jgi:2'-5' RNA ligase
MFAIEAVGLQFFGRGVAIRLASPELLALRARLKDSWESWLTSQDRQTWRPHVTIQNKVPPADAKQLHADLGQTFRPFPILAHGILLWRYEGGPWASLGGFPFAGA